MEFIGQERLLRQVNSYSISTLPHTLLLLGPEGCGKKTIAKYIANKLGLELVRIDETISNDKIIEFQQKPLKTLYLIDLSELTLEKEQNQFLKFIEEPSDTVYIILINSSEVGILPTVLNRCTKLRFDPYQINHLKQIKKLSNDLAYKVCTTPGQLANIDDKRLDELYKLCYTIVTKIKAAPYANMMSIAPRINYKEDYNKFDFTVFFGMLMQVALDEYVNNKNIDAMKIYIYLIKRQKDLVQNSNIAKEPFMISVLDGLWKEMN